MKKTGISNHLLKQKGVVIALFAFVVLGAYLFNQNRTLSQTVKNLNDKLAEMSTPSPIASPSPTFDPTLTATPSPSPLRVGSSDRAIRAATYVWLTMPEDEKNKAIAKYGDMNKVISVIATNLDNNRTALVTVETAVDYLQRNRNRSLNCSTSYIGDFAYTTCN